MATTYKTQDGDEIRPMNDEEIALLEVANAEVKKREEEETKRQALKTSILNKLGITSEEAIALLS